MRQWERSRDVLALGVLGSAVILTLLSVKLNKPAGRTENPVLDPSVSQGLLFPEVPGKSFAPCFFSHSNPVLCTFPKPVNTTKSHHSTARRDVSSCESPGRCWPGTVWPQAGLSHRERGERAGRWLRLAPGNCPWLRHVLAVGRGWENKHILRVTQGSLGKGLSLRARLDPLPRAPGQQRRACGIATSPCFPNYLSLCLATQSQSLG